MTTFSLPAASLRSASRLPAGRVLLWVSKCLAYLVLWAKGPAIFRVESIFLPASREAAAGRRDGRCHGGGAGDVDPLRQLGEALRHHLVGVLAEIGDGEDALELAPHQRLPRRVVTAPAVTVRLR